MWTMVYLLRSAWCREWGRIPTIVFHTSSASTCRSSVPRSCPASSRTRRRRLPSAVKTATYRVAVGVQTAGIRWPTAATATQQLAVSTHHARGREARAARAAAPAAAPATRRAPAAAGHEGERVAAPGTRACVRARIQGATVSNAQKRSETLRNAQKRSETLEQQRS